VDMDGILAWQELREDFDNDGSPELKMDQLHTSLNIPYSHGAQGGLAGYIDRFSTNLHELELLQDEEYTDKVKKRWLLNNLRGLAGADHLVQKCRDDPDMTFSLTAHYLRANSKNVSKDLQSKRIMTSVKDDILKEEDTLMDVTVTHTYLSYRETEDLFESIAKDSGIVHAYNVFNSGAARESFRIHPDIWKQLAVEVQEKIRAIRADLQSKRITNPPMSNPTPKPAYSGSKPSPPVTKLPSSIPAQYPSMRHTNKASTEQDIEDDLCETLAKLTTLEDDYDTDDDQLQRGVHMVLVSQPEDNDIITVRAHLEYAIKGEKHYAISDSGADSSILGKLTHVISHTGRFAYLVGYDPANTRSPKIPIVSGYLKVMSQTGIPIILLIHEAPYNANSPLTLISEYQAREYGTIIDSVSRRHKTISGSYGTQRMMVSSDVYVPFLDRGGLMGFEVLPWKIGDEERFEIFTITSDEKWTPRCFQESVVHTPMGGGW
jgi:hypothetical protein